MRPEEQLAEIRVRVLATSARIERLFVDELRPALDKEGIRLVDTADLTEEDRAWSADSFVERIFPVLPPLAVDPAHPFPYISSLSLNLAVLVGDPDGRATRIARVKVPPLLPRFVVLPDGERCVPLEQVIAAHLDRLFPGMRILGHHPFRVTRNADFALTDDHEEDVLSAVEAVLQKRRHSPQVMRLEIDGTMSDEVLGLLTPELEIGPDEVYRVDGPLDLGGLWGLYPL